MAKTCLHDGCHSQVFAGGYCKFHQHLTEKSMTRLKKNREGVHKLSYKQSSAKTKETIAKHTRNATKKPTQKKILTLIEICDYLFSRYIRQLAADKDGNVECYTCSKKIHWSIAQAGHYIVRRYYQFRFCQFNTKIQCNTCNNVKEGNLTEFSIRLIKEDKEKFEQMLLRKNDIFKITHSYLQELRLSLKEKLEQNGFTYNKNVS